MKKKNIKIFIIVIILLIVGYFGYKGVILYLYNPSRNNGSNLTELKENFKITGTINIVNKEAIDYLTYDNVKIRNDFKGFEKKDSYGGNIATFYLKNNNDSKSFIYGKVEEMVFYLKNGYYSNDYTSKEFEKLNKKKILEKYNINNDIKLIKYLSERQIKNKNIFTKIEDIKEDYFFNYLIMNELPKVSEIKLIKGKYDGYILNSNGNIYVVNLIKDNKKYYFQFMGSSYTYEYIEDFLNALVIE